MSKKDKSLLSKVNKNYNKKIKKLQKKIIRTIEEEIKCAIRNGESQTTYYDSCLNYNLDDYYESERIFFRTLYHTSLDLVKLKYNDCIDSEYNHIGVSHYDGVDDYDFDKSTLKITINIIK